MALTKSETQRFTNLENKAEKHEENIQESLRLTRYFTVIVAVTLVGTLVGLVGVYMNTISQSNKYEIDSKELLGLRKDVADNKDKLDKLQTKIEILKVKYPWLKDYNL